MSEGELPPLASAFALVALGLPFLTLALRRAARVLPRAETGVRHRWTPREVLAVLAVALAGMAASGALLGALSKGRGIGEVGLAAIVLSQLSLAGGVALAVALAARRPSGLAALGLAAPFPRRAPGAVLLAYGPFLFVFFGIALAWMHAGTRFGWDPQQEVMKLLLGFGRAELVVGALMAVLVAPLVEELLFRGFLQSFLGQILGPLGGLVLASALFAAMHGLPGLPALFALSLLLGWLQMRTRCVWVPCFAHALHNGVSLALALAAAAATG